ARHFAAIPEAGPRLDADEVAAVVAVLDVDDPEPPGAELGLLLRTDRAQPLAGADDVARSHRLVERDRVVAHHGLGQPEPLLQVEVHLQREWLHVPAGRPVVRPEPGRQRRRGCDRPAGQLGRHLVVPEQRVAVLDRGARRPDVAALDGELAGLVVLHDVDQRRDVVGQVGGDVAHPMTPSARSRAISSALKPADDSTASVSVADRSGTTYDAARSAPARRGASWRKGVSSARLACATAARSTSAGAAAASATEST